jgi:hypothetical protein
MKLVAMGMLALALGFDDAPGPWLHGTVTDASGRRVIPVREQ